MAPMDLALFLVLTLAIAELIVFGALVGRGRAKYGVPAPATSGHPTWERLNRVHLNSIEHFVVFAPLFLMYAVVVGRFTAIGLGVAYLIARILYAVGYVRDPKQRAIGAGLTSLVELWLTVGLIGSLIWRFSRGF
jgi:glutathione S-transferase